MGDGFCSGAGRREREGEEEVRPAGAALAEGASAWAEGAAGVGGCGGSGVLAAAQAPGCRVLRTGCLGGEGVRRGGVIVRAGAGARARQVHGGQARSEAPREAEEPAAAPLSRRAEKQAPQING